MRATSDGPATAADPPKPWRTVYRWRRGLAYGLLVLVLVTAGVWFAAPSVLRHLAGTQLDRWGIAYSGLDTLEVDLWRQRVRLGPVGFHVAGAAAGKATRLDARIDLGALFQRRVRIKELRAEGLDLLLERDGAGKFRLNGILLNPSRNVGKTRDRPPWDWGVESIALDDGRLLFRRVGGESLDLRARHLEATDLLSWDAESSGRASLVGELNGSAVDWKADLRLFRDPLSIDLVFRSENLVVAKHLADLIERGSFDFRPEAGRAVGRMLLEFPHRGGFRIRGNTDFEVARGALSLRQLEAGWEQLHLHWSDLDLRVAPDRDFSLALQYEYKGRGGRLNGPLELSTDLLFDLLEILQTLAGGTALSAEEMGLADWSGKAVTLPEIRLQSETFASDRGRLKIHTEDGKMRLSSSVRSRMQGVGLSRSDQTAEVESWLSDFERLKLETGGGRFSLEMGGNLGLQRVNIKQREKEQRFAALQVILPEVKLASRSGELSLEFRADTEAGGWTGLAPRWRHLDHLAFSVDRIAGTLEEGRLRVTPAGLEIRVRGEAVADQLLAESGQGAKARFGLAHARLSGIRMDSPSHLGAQELILGQPDVSLLRSRLQGLMAAEDDSSKAVPAAAADIGPEKAPGLAPETTTTEPIRFVQQSLRRLGLDPGPVDGILGPKTRAAIRTFQEAHELPVTGRMGPELLAQLDTAVREPDRRKVEAAPDPNAAPAPETASDAEPLTLSLEKLTLADNADILLRDDTVQPPVELRLQLQTLDLAHLDTRRSLGVRTQVRISGELEQSARSGLRGWVAPWSIPPEFELQGGLELLNLPPFNAYARDYAGVEISEGRLSADVRLASRGDRLDGLLELDLQGLRLQATAPEQDPEVHERLGFPAELAINLLKDPDDHIRLDLPVAGTPGKPQIDTSQAVSKAVGGMLEAVFPPAIIASALESRDDRGLTVPPLLFAPGEDRLDAAGRDYATRLARLLDHRPGLSLRLCGVAVARDFDRWRAAEPASRGAPEAADSAQPPSDARPTIKQLARARPALEALAESRAGNLRAYLTWEDRMVQERFADCQSLFDSEDTGAPRVEVILR